MGANYLPLGAFLSNPGVNAEAYAGAMDIYEARRLAVLELIRSRFAGKQVAFVEATGIPASYVSRMLKQPGDRTGKRIGEEIARRIEDKLGLPGDAVVSPSPLQGSQGETRQAHGMSYQPVTVPYLTREELMQSKELPASFWLELPDDALAPTAPKGTRAIFERREPAWGDAVLLFDAKGEPHVRVYRQSFEHAWEGHAANPHFAPLTSSTPGVRVVAVLESLGGGWARLSR